MERNLKLTIEQAQKLYKEQPEMRELLLTTFTKEELEGVVLRDWNELETINGFWIYSDSKIIELCSEKGPVCEYNKNVFATKKQAKSALAMAQLSQLMKDLGDECNIDWSNTNIKYVIKAMASEIKIDFFVRTPHFLAFKTGKVCNAFITKHERLIKDYFMLD